MHSELRDWLSDLRRAEPELARLVGEAVLAMLEAGESLRPPLAVPLESVLRPPDDPRAALDYSYQRQLEVLQQVRRGVAEVATSRKRVELQASQLEQAVARLAEERRSALDAGQEHLASKARAREAAVREHLAELRRQLSILAGEEEKATAASQRLQAKVDAFRTQKETLKATYTTAEAVQAAREALTGIGVAERMNVRDERVSAIERAEPGATEVRTLAAYVTALGGRLEIMADLGDERIMLR